MLGHESVEMALVYIGLTDEDVRQDYQNVLGPDALIAGPGAKLVQTGSLAESEIRWIESAFGCVTALLLSKAITNSSAFAAAIRF